MSDKEETYTRADLVSFGESIMDKDRIDMIADDQHKIWTADIETWLELKK